MKFYPKMGGDYSEGGHYCEVYGNYFFISAFIINIGIITVVCVEISPPEQ